MRAHALLPIAPIALLLVTSCNGSHDGANASPSPDASPSPLQSCETRELNLDGADLLIQANVDQTPASIIVVRAPDDDTRAKAFAHARKIFGDPHPDDRTEPRQYKWGLVQVTDMCGRPVMASPSPASSRG